MCATIMVDDADGGVNVNVRVVYTDLDGYENTRYLGSIRDAAFYNMTIHSFWGSIDSANKADQVAKDFCYGEILNLMNQQIRKYGRGYLPRNLKAAMNEIEVTVW